MKVLVTGATGTLGSALVQELRVHGHDALPSSRTKQSGWLALDFLRPSSIGHIPSDVEAVVHCAASGNPGKTVRVEGDGMVALRKALPRARIVYPSIVGCDKIHAKFFQAKAASERLLAEAGGDHAVVRFTQFHEFADRLARLPLPMCFAGMHAETLAASEAASFLVDAVEGDAQGRLRDVGGPERHVMLDLVKARLRADGRRRWVLPMPVATRDLRAGRNLCGPDAQRGRITWAEHLRAT